MHGSCWDTVQVFIALWRSRVASDSACMSQLGCGTGWKFSVDLLSKILQEVITVATKLCLFLCFGSIVSPAKASSAYARSLVKPPVDVVSKSLQEVSTGAKKLE